MINVFTVQGRLTDDMKVSVTPNGKSVGKFSIANNRYYGKEYCNFFRVEMWGERVNRLAMYMKKGIMVNIQGELKHERWEKDGIKFSGDKVIVQEIALLSRPEEKQQRPAVPDEAKADYPDGHDHFEDEIPF
jgi:single-strand DNA-binding protein